MFDNATAGRSSSEREKEINKDLRMASGSVDSDDKLVCFLYLLLGDKLPAGQIEVLVRDAEIWARNTEYSNGWLAEYAKNIAQRLR
jgi:hypothetical protein